ncbi:hypothetical protein CO709_07545 [Burkholderia thailandensis]|nr:hypothetical protein CO709_07545 [Burkholderia thailandensis]
MRAEHHLVAARRQRPAHPQQRMHVARRPDRRHDYLRHRFVIPSRAAAGGTSGLAKRSNRIVHPRPDPSACRRTNACVMPMRLTIAARRAPRLPV